jgi:hypothetical protein
MNLMIERGRCYASLDLLPLNMRLALPDNLGDRYTGRLIAEARRELKHKVAVRTADQEW